MKILKTEVNGEIVLRLAPNKYDATSIEGRTSDAAARKVGRYELIFIGATRIRELNKGHAPLVKKIHGNSTTAIQEIEAGLIDASEYLLKSTAVPRSK